MCISNYEDGTNQLIIARPQRFRDEPPRMLDSRAIGQDQTGNNSTRIEQPLRRLESVGARPASTTMHRPERLAPSRSLIAQGQSVGWDQTPILRLDATPVFARFLVPSCVSSHVRLSRNASSDVDPARSGRGISGHRQTCRRTSSRGCPGRFGGCSRCLAAQLLLAGPVGPARR